MLWRQQIDRTEVFERPALIDHRAVRGDKIGCQPMHGRVRPDDVGDALAHHRRRADGAKCSSSCIPDAPSF